jgi:molecular chaperone Hsp33
MHRSLQSRRSAAGWFAILDAARARRRTGAHATIIEDRRDAMQLSTIFSPQRRARMSDGDFLLRFLLERAQLRGVLVRLDASWRQVRERADYPPVVADLLARVLTASALFTGNIKFEGSLSIQLKAAGALSLLFAECAHEGSLRGLARWREDLPEDFTLTGAGDPLLAITIENSASGQRYQGVVPVDADDPAVLFARYFERSEQLPTRVLLAADGERCAGLMLQQLPASGAGGDDDAWNRSGHLLATLGAEELLAVPPERLLLRLFHEESVRVLSTQPLRFGCRCSRERVAAVLRTLGRDEAQASVQADGRIEVTCEFCNTHYHFDAVDIEQVFRDSAAPPPDSSVEH